MRDALVRILSDDAGMVEMMRSGLARLSDEEYFWEPVEDCWSVRPLSRLRTPTPPWKAAADGWAVDISYPDPVPAPFTTIAWRLTHMTGSIHVARATLIGSRREDGAIDDTSSGDDHVARTASEAVQRWDEAVRALQSQVVDASDDDLDRTERQWWDPPDHSAPVWEHVLYFGYFEPASHGAEIRLLRDLFRHTSGGRTIRAANPDQ